MGSREGTLSIGGVCITGIKIFGRQVGEVLEDLLLGHPRREVAKDIIDGDSHSSDAGLSATLARFYGNDVLISHSYDFSAR